MNINPQAIAQVIRQHTFTDNLLTDPTRNRLLERDTLVRALADMFEAQLRKLPFIGQAPKFDRQAFYQAVGAEEEPDDR